MNAPANSSAADELSLSVYSPGIDRECLAILHECFGPAWGDLERWRNKHARRPDFDGRDVYLFSVADTPAACFHLRFMDLTLEPDLVVKIGLGGDFAVRPQFRRRGLVEEAQRHFTRYFYEQGAAIRAGFTSGELHARVYRKKFGDIFVPTVTTGYRKLLDSGWLAEKLRAYAEALRTRFVMRRALRRGPLDIAITVPGYETCRLELTKNSVQLVDGASRVADMQLTIPYDVLAAVRQRGPRKVRVLFTNILAGKLRIRGMMRFLTRLI
jgi:hypothetical protein